jgi:hypothetical protein
VGEVNNMPPEMVVRFRLLGYSSATLHRWDKTFGISPIEKWWDWIELLERDPLLLQGSLEHYSRQDRME